MANHNPEIEYIVEQAVKLPDERVGVISKSPDTIELIELTNLPPKVRVSITKMFTKV